MQNFQGVQVFSATKHTDRDDLGNRITEWITANIAAAIKVAKDGPLDFGVVNVIVTQSSDSEFHCLTITMFYMGEQRVQPRLSPVPQRPSSQNGNGQGQRRY